MTTNWSAEIDKVARQAFMRESFGVAADQQRVVPVADVLALLQRVEAEVWNDAIATALTECPRTEMAAPTWTQAEMVAVKKCMRNIRQLLRPTNDK